MNEQSTIASSKNYIKAREGYHKQVNRTVADNKPRLGTAFFNTVRVARKRLLLIATILSNDLLGLLRGLRARSGLGLLGGRLSCHFSLGRALENS